MRGCRPVSIGLAIVVTLASAAVSSDAASLQSGTRHTTRPAGIAPDGTFHVLYRSAEKTDSAGIMFDVLVSPRTRAITGVFEMTQPARLQAHISGAYTQSSSTSPLTASLSGFPQVVSPCMGHGPAVSENTRITLRIDPDWRHGTADISYATDRASPRHLTWKEASGVAISGPAPVRWRDVSDILWVSRSPVAWNGKCFGSDSLERQRLRRLGADNSRQNLTLTHETDGHAWTSWAVRNDSGRHVLARISCESHAAGHRDIDGKTTLVRPFETQGLFGFSDKAQRTCELVQSHYD